MTIFLNFIIQYSICFRLESDASAHSGDQDPLSVVNSNVFSSEIKESLDPKSKENESSDQWDDEAMVANTFRKNVTVVSNTPSTSAGLLDMKSFDSKSTDPDNIAEKLRVEETKAQLAAAREGMEREAAKLKEEKDKKDQKKQELEKSRFGTAAASMSGTGGKWVAPHLRNSAASSITRPRIAPSGFQKLDVADEELFPDLASADKILEKKERDKGPVIKAPKKTPVGAGASWASKPIIPKEKVETEAPTSIITEEKVESEVSEPASEPVASQPEPAPESDAQVESDQSTTVAPDSEAVNTQPVVKKTVVKKKKKDLSTFKPGA